MAILQFIYSYDAVLVVSSYDYVMSKMTADDVIAD